MTQRDLPGTARTIARAAPMLAALLASACTFTTDFNGPGTLAVRRPGTLPPVTAPRPVQPAPPPNGTFAGIGTLTSSVGGACRRQMPIRNMVVNGQQVRMLNFRGTIQPDSFLMMQANGRFLYGYFNGPRFVGHYWQPAPDCTYDLVLAHTG